MRAMGRWSEPGLDPAGDPSQGPQDTENKDSSSPASSQENETKWSLGPTNWQLPPFLVTLVYCLSKALWVSLYEPLLGLSVALADLAVYYLSISVVGLFILWRTSLQTAGALTLILARKLCMEVVMPIHQAVWHPWLEIKAWSLAFFCTLLRWTWGYTWTLLGNLSYNVSMAVLSWAKGTYGSLLSFYQDKGRTLELILSSILQQLFFTLFMSCLAGFWAVFYQWGIIMRGKCSQLLDSARHWWGHGSITPFLEVCASSLSSSSTPLSRRFPGPDPSTLSWHSPDSVSLPSLVVQSKALEGAQDYPWRGGSQLPLSARFQGRGATPSPSGQALAQQVKTACALVILLYIYGVTLIIQILK